MQTDSIAIWKPKEQMKICMFLFKISMWWIFSSSLAHHVELMNDSEPLRYYLHFQIYVQTKKYTNIMIMIINKN